MKSVNTCKGIFIILALGILFFAGCTNQTQQTTTTSSTQTRSSTTMPAAQGNTVELTLTAQNIAFDQKTITVPAGAHIKLLFKNEDANTPHNFALYDSQQANTNYFKGQVIRGVAEITYEFDAPTIPGTYFFRCDPHAQIMNGDFIVQ